MFLLMQELSWQKVQIFGTERKNTDRNIGLDND